MLKIVRFGMATGLFSCCLVVVAGCAKKNPTANPDKGSAKVAEQGPAKDPEVKTTAEGMAKEVIADEKAAETKYKDKVVEVEGKVQYANKIIGNNRSITLVGAKKKPTDIIGVDVRAFPPPPASRRRGSWAAVRRSRSSAW